MISTGTLAIPGFAGGDMGADGGNASTGAYDVVSVMDGYSQVFAKARPMKASVREQSKLAEHTIEDGSSITDHKAFKSVEVDISCIVTPEGYRDTYAEIKRHFMESTLLTVQTLADTYENMVIENLPHDEGGEIADTIPVEIKLKQARLITPQYTSLPPRKVKDKRHSGKKKRGKVKGKKTTARDGSNGRSGGSGRGGKGSGDNDSRLYKWKHG